MKQPLEKPMEEQEQQNTEIDRERLLSEEDASKVSGGATTGGAVDLGWHRPIPKLP